jgi:hypothetical protein
MEFESFAKTRCAALPARVQVAVEKRKRAMPSAPGVVIHSVTGAQVQIGDGNTQSTTNIITLNQFVEQVIASKDEKAKSLLAGLLNNAAVGGILGAGTAELLLKLFGN